VYDTQSYLMSKKEVLKLLLKLNHEIHEKGVKTSLCDFAQRLVVKPLQLPYRFNI